MAILIKGLHIEEIIIDADPEEEKPELSWNLAGTSQEPLQEEPAQEEPKHEPEKATPKKTNRKEIDKGKVGALYKANWTISKIADEMGCSAPTIRKALRELGLIG